MPDQYELRLRLRAARMLKDLTVEALAERIPPEAKMGERVIRKLENGESQIKPQALRELAAALEFPYSYFTVKSIADQFPGEKEDRRYADFERRMEESFTQRLEALRAELLRDPATTAAVPAPAPKRRSPRSIRPAGGRP